MPWLADLVSEGSFEILPVQSLCEFMMGQTERLVKLVNTEAEHAEQITTDKSSKRGKSSHAPDMTKEESRGMQLLQYLQVSEQLMRICGLVWNPQGLTLFGKTFLFCAAKYSQFWW